MPTQHRKHASFKRCDPNDVVIMMEGYEVTLTSPTQHNPAVL